MCSILQVEELIAQLQTYADEWKDVPMLAKTHGQPASPTRLGKEIMVFVYRLTEQLEQLEGLQDDSQVWWCYRQLQCSPCGLSSVRLAGFRQQVRKREAGSWSVSSTPHRSATTTTSDAMFDAIRRINTIIIDLDRDFWMYISMEYFKQKIKAGEVGSSAMPHKVNPIDFENSEGNLGMANAILQFLAQKLPVSRLQATLPTLPYCVTSVYLSVTA